MSLQVPNQYAKWPQVLHLFASKWLGELLMRTELIWAGALGQSQKQPWDRETGTLTAT